MTQLKLTLGVATLLALVGPASAQNLLVNGNFSADTAPTNQSATGWTAGGNGLFPGNGGVRNDALSISGNYYYLNEAAGFQVGLSQVVSFTPGAQLNLTGVYATRDLGSGTNSFAIRVFDATSNTLLHQSTFNPTGVGNWTAFNVTTSVLSSSNLRISYVSQVGSDDDYMIDNLVAQSAAAPEPSAAFLTLLGLPFILRRRK